jgi:hypothetical protein
MLDSILDWAAVFLPTLLSIGGVLVSMKAPHSKHHRAWRVGLVGVGLAISALTVWQQSRSRTAHATEVSTLNGKLNTLEGKLSTVQGNLKMVQGYVGNLTQQGQTEAARRQQAEKDLAIIVQGTGKSTREGVVSDIKAGRASTPLAVENIKLFSRPEKSTHADAPYAVRMTFQADTSIPRFLLNVHFNNELKYVSIGPKVGSGGNEWYGGIEIAPANKKVVALHVESSGDAILSEDSPLIVNVESDKPISVAEFIRFPNP